jgi:PKHD-type hydroxylase
MADPVAIRPQLTRPDVPPYHPVQVHRRAFTPAQCDRIIELGSSLPTEHAGLEGEDGRPTSDPGLRDARTAWIPVSPATEWIYRKLAAVAERANRQYRFDLTGFDEDLQFTNYDRPGAFYTWHQDGLDGTVGTRKLSLVAQLSDPAGYRGGELELFATVGDHLAQGPGPSDGRDVPPWAQDTSDPALARGTVIVFPSFEFHRVRPLRSGVRHSLVSWVSGPPFR